MNTPLELSDIEFVEKLENCTLDPSFFNHEAHVRLGYIYISNYGIDQAIEKYQIQLKKHVAYLGASSKYNTTLTIAALKAVYHFMLKATATTFKDFIAEFPRLKFQFKELIEAHYSPTIFSSEIAKKQFIKPDLLPFD